ncbi:MAG: membrane lipoprotein lipid attachment site-containing protein [Bacteroidota bacterium]|nr:membrane lipoprotein lipid attachment site-containing protein [Bacteroidota bacterium]
MKKIIFVTVLLFALVSCNSNSSKTESSEDSTKTDIKSTQNVNGNIPDTTNSIGTSEGDPNNIDSSRIKSRDSTKK